jgi:hypothetical protein
MPNLLLKAKIVERFGTQADFSKAIGKDPVFVSQVIRNRKVLNSNGRRTWARVLGCKMDIFEMRNKDMRE